MTKIAYTEKNFRGPSLAIIDQANDIIREYDRQGFKLTLRQLYYQFVARDLLENKKRAYKRLGSIINDARLAGMVSWRAIEDRTRFLRGKSHWDTPADIINSCVHGYNVDHWKSQDVKIEVWIEKDALVGVIQQVCTELDLDYFSCRGYVSQSEMWNAVERWRWDTVHNTDGEDTGERQDVVILHLGDHDPSGIDMTRDIQDRLNLFGEHRGFDVDVRRIALNMNQIHRYQPPPNPTKDARSAGYIEKYGMESWELDALEPQVLSDLVRRHAMDLMDQGSWNTEDQKQRDGRSQLLKVSRSWEDIVADL